MKKCQRENLVNLLAFCLNLGEKAINPSFPSFSSLSQKSGTLVQKSHSANTATYIQVTVLPCPKCKWAACQTCVNLHVRQPLLFSAAKWSGKVQIPVGTYAERGWRSPKRKGKAQAEKGILGTGQIQGLASKQDHDTEGLPTDHDGKYPHLGRERKGLGQSGRHVQSMHACTEQSVHVQQT